MDRIFCRLDCFLPFYHHNLKNQNFKKLKKDSGDIIILRMCTINDNHKMYGSWDMKHEGENFLSFWTILYPFTPITTQKIKILKNWKKSWRYHHFTHMYHKLQSYDIWFLRYWAQQTVFCHFGQFFVNLSPKSLKNQNFKKMKKTSSDIIILHKCTKNHDHMQYCSWDMACDACNCYFSFWAIFCPFTPLTAQKIKISKKMRHHHFTHVYKKLWLDDVRFQRFILAILMSGRKHKKLNLLIEFSNSIFIKFYLKASWCWTCIQNKLAMFEAFYFSSRYKNANIFQGLLPLNPH